MTSPRVILFSNGGIRSTVAIALMRSDTRHPDSGVMQISDGRIMAKFRLGYIQKQAKHFGIDHVLEVQLPRRTGQPGRSSGPSDSPPKCRQIQVLFAGMMLGIEIAADKLVWPVQVDGQFKAAGRITEQTVLLSHMLELDQVDLPELDMPLLDLTDQQVIELGGQLEVPWKLAWSCQFNGDKPCRVCDPCRRRQRAFEAAGMIDPMADTHS